MLKSVTLSSHTMILDIIDANFFAPLSSVELSWAKLGGMVFEMGLLILESIMPFNNRLFSDYKTVFLEFPWQTVFFFFNKCIDCYNQFHHD